MIQEPRTGTDATIEHSDRYVSTSYQSSTHGRTLLVVTTANSSRVIELDDSSALTVGRTPPADLQIPDPSLSRQHARLRREGDAIRVVDLGSRNGTWVHGRRVEEALVRVGETIVIGKATLSVQLALQPEAAKFGLTSSPGMMAHIEQEFARSRTFSRPLSLLVVRPIMQGRHAATELRMRCLRALRSTDCAGLYDRNAVIVVLPETGREDARRVAERIVSAEPPGVQLICGLATLSEGEACFTAAQFVSATWDAARTASATRPIAVADSGEAPARPAPGGVEMVRRSPAMLELSRMVARLAPRPITVLLQGETGTGKELIANELHQRSSRAKSPLKVVNCAAIPDQLVESVFFGHVRGAFTGAHRDQTGIFAQAHGGTLFLDEVGELSRDAQAALLRVLESRRICPIGATQEREVDVRVVAATHRDLTAMSERGEFRVDLYHRLASVVLRVPPLRERREEVGPLLERFMRALSGAGTKPPRVSEEAMAALYAYHWPGNVRELRNVVERALALYESGTIEVGDLPLHLSAPEPTLDREAVRVEPACKVRGLRAPEPCNLRDALQQRELELIQEALARSEGNQRRAAAQLRVPLRTLERKLRLQRQRSHSDEAGG